jgi:hypothetical protein
MSFHNGKQSSPPSDVLPLLLLKNVLHGDSALSHDSFNWARGDTVLKYTSYLGISVEPTCINRGNTCTLSSQRHPFTIRFIHVSIQKCYSIFVQGHVVCRDGLHVFGKVGGVPVPRRA